MGKLGFFFSDAPRKTAIFYSRMVKIILEQHAVLTDRQINDTLLKQLIMQFVEAERKLVDLNALKNRFLGIAAHDLRNPLVSIRGFSEVMLEGGVDEESQKEYLAIINKASNDMLDLLNNLLDISLIESGKFSLNPEKGALKELLEERLHLFEVHASKKDMVLVRQFTGVPEIPFDKSRIAQLFDNLVSNAIKYSPLGSRITVRLAIEDGMAAVRVIDQGPGIPPGEGQKLFGEFQKLGTRPTGGEKVTGLGLSIAKKIVEAHRGRIGVAPAPGKGSEFFFMLPLEG